jgi:RNA polymerase sigma-70 factor (ECF subfamily)
MSPLSPPQTWDLGRYRPLLRVLAWQLHIDRRLQRRFDGSDVVNEALVRAVGGLGQFRGTTEAELVKWLQEILHNTFQDMVRREQAGRRDPGLEASLRAVVADSSARLDRFIAAGQSSPSKHLEGQEVLLRWADAVERLPREQRDVVILRDLQERPVKEIAALTGRTEKSVAGLLLRGRRELRRSFPDYQEQGAPP